MKLLCLPLVLASLAYADGPLSITTPTLAPAMAGGAHIQVLAASGGTTPYTFTATGLPGGLTLSTNGSIFGIAAATGTSAVTITVRDAANATASRQYSLVVVPFLEISTAALPDAMVGQSYSQSLTATGGTTPYSFSATGLPGGMNIGPAGLISGTPTVGGTRSVVVTVQDAQLRTRTKVLTLNVVAPLTITTIGLANGVNGSSYQQALAASGGTPPYTFSSTTLPAGLTLSAGSITGTPIASGSFQTTLLVMDSQGRQASKQLPLLIVAGLTITTPFLPPAAVGQSYSYTVTAAGGNPPYTFSATGLSGSISISPSGMISGTPTATGTGTVTVSVTDSKQVTVSRAFPAIVVTLPSIAAPSPLPQAAVDIPYAQTLGFSGGVAPYTWALAAGSRPLPPGLQMSVGGVIFGTATTPGVFDFSVQLTDGNQNRTTKPYQMSVRAAGDLLSVTSENPIEISAILGGELPGPENIAISSTTSSNLRVIAQVDDGKGGPPPAWLQYRVSPMNGLTPSLIRINAQTAGLAVGTYTGRVRIGVVASGSVASASDIPVRLIVSDPPPKPRLFPTLLRYGTRLAAPKAQEQTFTLRNLGGGGPLPVALSLVDKSAWISKVEASGTSFKPGTPVVVKVTVNPSGLAVGSYRDAVRVTTSIGTYDVPVLLYVFGPGPIMTLGRDGVRFSTRQGNTTSRNQQVVVRNLGDPGTTMNWTAQVVRGADLVTLSTPLGTSSLGSPSSFGIKLSSTASASAGSKSALIQVSAPQGQLSPQFVTVVADIASASMPVAPDPDPAGLAFVATSGSRGPASQEVTVNVSSPDPVAFSVTSSTDDGEDWLNVVPQSGMTSLSDPAELDVSVASGKLTPGVYTGLVNISIGTLVRAVNVTMVIRPDSGNASPLGRAQADILSASCVPTSVAIVQTGIPSNFAVPAGWPATLSATVGDSCGNVVPDATVVASFSNGDPPLTLSADQDGVVFSTSWQPGTAAASTVVTLDATSSALAPARVQLSGRVNPNATPAPSLVIAGLLNNLNAVVGAPLAPGTVTQVYGQNLTPTPASPSSVPLPTVLKGVEAIVGGVSSPIYYISDTQLTIQVPAELAPGPYLALLVANGQYSQPQPLTLKAVAPGILTLSDGTLIAQHGNASLVDAGHPAQPGEALVTYLVGMGATNPPVPSGTVAPANPLARTPSQVQLTIDGQSTPILFAGMTPGGVGLYQLNFTVPQTAKNGDLEVIFTQDGVKANIGKLLVAR